MRATTNSAARDERQALDQMLEDFRSMVGDLPLPMAVDEKWLDERGLISVHSSRRARVTGTGPRFFKDKGAVKYLLTDFVRWYFERLQTSTSGALRGKRGRKKRTTHQPAIDTLES